MVLILNSKNFTIFFFSLFIIYNIPNLITHLSNEKSLFQLPSQNIQAQLQQQTDYIKYQFQSHFIKEFEIPIDNNETGLKGITTDSKNNVWFFHNTNTSSTIIEFNPFNNTFTKYPISKKTNVDSAITNLAGGQIIYDKTRNLIWFSDARTNSLGKLNLTDKQIELYDIPTNNSGIMGITLSPDNKSIWFAEIIGNNIGNFDIESNNILEYPTGHSTGPTLLTFDNEGFLWSSLSYSNEILHLEPWMVIPGIELNGMLRIKLAHPDIYSPFGISVISNNNKTNTLFVSDHGSSRIIAIPVYNQNILNEETQNYTSYWTSPSKSFPNTLPSEIVSDKDGKNVYFAEHGGNRIAKFSLDTKTTTEYEIPTGPLATTVFVSLSNDNTKVWFTEWASNKIGYLDIKKQIPFTMILANGSLSDKPIIFNNNNTSYQTNVSLIRNNFTSSNQHDLLLGNIALSLSGMSDSGPKGITYSFNPQRINLTESNKENSLLQLNMVKDNKIRSENNTLMIIANTFNKDNLTTSLLQPLPISIIKPEDSYTDSSSSSTLEETTTTYKNYNQLTNLPQKSEIDIIDIIKYLSLAIAIILIGFIIYKKIKNRKITKKK
jgi:virginiamycin B lyase